MKFIIGTKVEMVQYFTPEGKVVPATVIATGPATVTQVKTKETDGYDAVQVGFGEQKKERVTKARLGHMGAQGIFRHLKEFRSKTGALAEMKVGDVIEPTVFAPGDTVRVTGTSKGKGFQGVVKRHGFHGGPRTHGQKHSEREPGSIGGGLRNRVPKGMRMAGRTGGDTITVQNLKIVDVDTTNNLLVVKGAIPGRRGTVVSIVG
jgi:large subunit ribosomal protein L3